MIITNIYIRKTFTTGKLKAIVSIVLNDCITINDIKIVQGHSRIYVAMPACKSANGEFRDIIHPMYSDTRAELETKILDAYRNCIM